MYVHALYVINNQGNSRYGDRATQTEDAYEKAYIKGNADDEGGE